MCSASWNCTRGNASNVRKERMIAFRQVLQVSPCRKPQVHDCLDPADAAYTHDTSSLARSTFSSQHTHTHTHTHTRARLHTHTDTHTYTYARTHTPAKCQVFLLGQQHTDKASRWYYLSIDKRVAGATSVAGRQNILSVSERTAM